MPVHDWCLVMPMLLAGTSVLAQTLPASTSDDSARGKKLFEAQCARCHGMKGAGGIGAALTHPKLRHADNDQELFAVIQDGIPGTAMSGNWFLTDTEIWQVVRYVRSLGRTPVAPAPGDPARGKLVFERSSCAACHIIAGKGGGAGPDLTEVGTRRGLDYLRKSIQHPGAETLLGGDGFAAYLAVVVATPEGRVVAGTRMNEDTFTIQLRDEKLRFHSFRKRDLETWKKSDGSLMPSYEKIISASELDHLISYLASLRGKR